MVSSMFVNRTPRIHRVSLWLVVLASLAAFALRAAHAQVPGAETRALPFAVGEVLTYHASFAHLPAGTARMQVAGMDTVRGQPAYHLVFTIDGGVIGFRVHDRYDSWIDSVTLSSVRYRQEISEGRYHRVSDYEIFPDRAVYQRAGDTVQASVGDPLDDGSFIYAVRLAAVEVGETRRIDRYFQPDRNPVVLTGVTRDTVSVGAGTFATVRVHPTIRTTGLFSENGDAQVWFTDDAHRYPVQLKARFSKFTIILTLDSIGSSNDRVGFGGAAAR